MRMAFDRLNQQAERFNAFYLNDIELKVTATQTAVRGLVNQVKFLQEKSRAWEAFRHQIDAVNDRLSSIERKFDVLSKSQEEAFRVGANVEYVLNRMSNKVDALNEMCLEVSDLSRERKVSLHDSGRQRRKTHRNFVEGQANKPNNLMSPMQGIFSSWPHQDTSNILLENTQQTLKSLGHISQRLQAVENHSHKQLQTHANYLERLSTCCRTIDINVMNLSNRVDSSLDELNSQRCGRDVSRNITEATPTTASTHLEITEHNNESGCHQLQGRNYQDGVYQFGSMNLVCSFDENGAGWTVIQRRGVPDNGNAENFNRSWSDYRTGFGDLNGEFWLGNDAIHRLTSNQDVKLKIILTDWNDAETAIEYRDFVVEDEQTKYRLTIRSDHPEPLDSMAYHDGQFFSTFDRQNDKADAGRSCCSCSVSYGSGWWFNK